MVKPKGFTTIGIVKLVLFGRIVINVDWLVTNAKLSIENVVKSQRGKTRRFMKTNIHQ
jgi:hypothetical protein